MLKLKLTFNESLEFVKVVLSGEGSYLVEEKREHVEVLIMELCNLIKHERPDILEFDSVINEWLLIELNRLNITYDKLNKKLQYLV